MKKILAVTLCALLLMTPMLSLAAPLIQEWLVLGGEYLLPVPEQVELDDVEKYEFGTLQYYEDFSGDMQLVVCAGDEAALAKSFDADANTLYDVAIAYGAEDIGLTAALKRELGGEGVLCRMTDDEDVYFYLILQDGKDVYLVSSYGPLEMEDELLSWVNDLCKL